jgi:N-acetylmuramoyl-L-alanine amidase CwlA
MEKTVKIRAYTGENNGDIPKENPADDINSSLQLAMKSAQLEEEKSRTLENLKTIVQLRESLKQEQEKNAGLVKSVADLQGKLNKLASVEENQLVKKNTQLEDERKKSGEQLKAIELLKESLKTEKDKNALQAISSAELHAKLNKLSEAEENQLLKKNTLLEEEKKKSLQYAKEIDLFKERLKQEQAKTADLEKKTATQEIKVKELTELLGKISTIAAGVKAG